MPPHLLAQARSIHGEATHARDDELFIYPRSFVGVGNTHVRVRPSHTHISSSLSRANNNAPQPACIFLNIHTSARFKTRRNTAWYSIQCLLYSSAIPSFYESVWCPHGACMACSNLTLVWLMRFCGLALATTSPSLPTYNLLLHVDRLSLPSSPYCPYILQDQEQL